MVKMTPERAVEVVARHVEAVRRGDPEALAIDREVNRVLRAEERASKARRKRLDALSARLRDLADDGLAKVEALVASLPRRKKSDERAA